MPDLNANTRANDAQQPSIEQLKAALAKAAARLREVDQERNEPIAIVGLSCRFPGAPGPVEYWRMLREGVDAVREVPPERWSIDDYYDPDPNAAGKIITRSSGFLDRVDLFDAEFFGISPREARCMDPQQRLLLEVSWEALESAASLPQRDTGVFVGISTLDYLQCLRDATPEESDIYLATGNSLNAAAGRISYLFGLTGPCMAVDTACSSSLVAVHLACQSLRSRECRQALAGGVTLIVHPGGMVAMSRWGILSPDGRCRPFGAGANGMARGEGCGILLLKRLSDARADGDNILAVIRASAVNQDGPSSGLTVPNGVSQEALIRQALQRARLEPADLDYVEAHGTGTSLGDPIEANALAAVRGHGPPLLIGSVKSNIAHSECAAGVAGLIKVVMALQYELIPPSLHAGQLSPYIDWANLPLRVVTQATPWPKTHKPRVAGVSGFGLAGTNAHVIVAETPTPEKAGKPDHTALPPHPWHLLTLSAKNLPALNQLARHYQAMFMIRPDQPLADICFTAAQGRRHFEHRLCLVADSHQAMLAQLASVISAEAQNHAGYGRCLGRQNRPKMAFLFTGQGSQYIQMGRELYETQPVFREALHRCADILAPQMDKPLFDILYPSADHGQPFLDQTQYTQPALFALEYALAALWKSWGIQPDIVMGHSLGELSAACVAGVFSLEDGLKLAAARGRLMSSLPHGGEMAVVMASEDTVAKAMGDTGVNIADIAIAAVNGPQNTVISGVGASVRTVAENLASQGIQIEYLTVSHAFHSPLIEPILAEFGRIAREITYKTPEIQFISNVSGKALTHEITKPAYWVRHVRQPVRFADGVTALKDAGVSIYVEIGPKPTLLGMARKVLEYGNDTATSQTMPVMLPSLRPGRPNWEQMMQSLGLLHVHGADIDWSGVYRGYAGRKTVLPTYPFQRQRYWVQASANPKQGTNSSPKAAAPKVDHVQGQEENPALAFQRRLRQAGASERQTLLLGWLRTTSAQILGLPGPETLRIDAGPGYSGMDSLMVTELHGRIKRETGLEIAWTELHIQTFSALASILASQLNLSIASNEDTSIVPEHDDGISSSRWVRPLNPQKDPHIRLFCFPFGGGGASLYRGWHKLSPISASARIEVCPIHLPGREDRLLEAPIDRLDALLDALVHELKPYVNQPFALFGHSLGGRIAFELAHALRQAYAQEPAHLFVAAYDAPQTIVLSKNPIHLRSNEALLPRIRQLGMLPEGFKDDDELILRSLDALRADVRTIETTTYAPKNPLTCPVTVLGGLRDSLTRRDALSQWNIHTTGHFDMYMLPGEHDFVRTAQQAVMGLVFEKLMAAKRKRIQATS